MERHYHHLNCEERASIQIDVGNGVSLRSIAERLGRSPSAISLHAIVQRVSRIIRRHWQAKSRRGQGRKTTTGISFVPEEQRIIHRPEEIESRLLPGRREGDFIKSSCNRSAVGTLVERKTRWVVLCRMDGGTAIDALEGFDRQMKRLPACLRESCLRD